MYKKKKPPFKQKIAELVAIKLDSEEEYEKKAFEIDLMDFYKFLENCQSVWTFTPQDEKYICPKWKKERFFGSAGLLDSVIEYSIKSKGLNIYELPLIAMVEYKLVPTGNIEYFDPLLTAKQRRDKRYYRNEAGLKKKQEFLAKQKERIRAAKKSREEEKE